jgi:hypothetical protein
MNVSYKDMIEKALRTDDSDAMETAAKFLMGEKAPDFVASLRGIPEHDKKAMLKILLTNAMNDPKMSTMYLS